MGLRQPGSTAAFPLAPGFEPGKWVRSPGENYTAYAGTRERTRLGLSISESFGGIAYALSEDLAASLELGALEATELTPRRYALSWRLQTSAGADGSLSLGLTYRRHDMSLASRLPYLPEADATMGYRLVPVRAPGTGLGPSYQLQLQYQYSPATSFGLLLGKELETYTPGFADAGAGLRRFSFSGQHWLTPSWALSYDVLSDDPGSLRLQGLRLGVRYRF